MRDVWFVTPCHGRVDLTRVCLRQLAWARDRLVGTGIKINAVIVACDENIDTARELGFETVTQAPDYLGRKYNDGYQHARARGADYLVQWASDNWIRPLFLGSIPEGPRILTGHWMAMVDETGDNLAHLYVKDASNPFGAGPFIFPANLLDPLGGRPLDDDISYGTDRQLVERLLDNNRSAHIEFQDLDAFQIVGFKWKNSLTSWADLQPLATGVSKEPWRLLARVYPEELVKEAQAVYEQVYA